MTITKNKIERKIPRKSSLGSGSPGFLKDDFMKHLLETATRLGDSQLLKQKSKFLKAHTSSGYKHAIDELLGNPDFKIHLSNVKAVDEVHALQT
eukprot:CAMPEP_0119043094 /NCGR_PEP_ID=MMETSP1177-20130426/17226_1 /TAXON_ID=2985 /ORGANISM="Ochromonas sp, Strain CCMP1899" /LENGTH=93 /DNA_ID=CAMNT_0007010403 /DNA_START=258 /DNA_END=535 /DNA_ORIENTATION=-